MSSMCSCDSRWQHWRKLSTSSPRTASTTSSGQPSQSSRRSSSNLATFVCTCVACLSPGETSNIGFSPGPSTSAGCTAAASKQASELPSTPRSTLVRSVLRACRPLPGLRAEATALRDTGAALPPKLMTAARGADSAADTWRRGQERWWRLEPPAPAPPPRMKEAVLPVHVMPEAGAATLRAAELQVQARLAAPVPTATRAPTLARRRCCDWLAALFAAAAMARAGATLACGESRNFCAPARTAAGDNGSPWALPSTRLLAFGLMWP
mmetsp:Transcript_23619/g.67716  ORF Transcript_23619/g.67716 Transcript_23619/m.67716 type:complete len:267 (+) Transcript_23619:1413-2213(+)